MMNKIFLTFNVVDQTVYRTDTQIVAAGTRNVYHARFSFNGPWDGIAKTAIFKRGESNRPAEIDENGECEIPWEVIDQPGEFYVGAMGGILMTTSSAEVLILQAVVDGDYPTEPTPSLIAGAIVETRKNRDAAANCASAALQYLKEVQSGATDEKVKFTAITPEDSEGTVFTIPFTDDSSTHAGGLKMCGSVLQLTGGNGAMAQLTIGNGRGIFKGYLVGNADYASQASCLIEGSKIGLSGAVTGTPTEFYGDEDITIPVTAVDPTKLSDSVPITKGGTGASTAAAALVNLGLSATAAEINYCQGVTSNIQSQLNAILDRIKVVNELPADAEEHPNTIYLVIENGGDAS